MATSLQLHLPHSQSIPVVFFSSTGIFGSDHRLWWPPEEEGTIDLTMLFQFAAEGDSLS